jgi:hypothetical protein
MATVEALDAVAADGETPRDRIELKSVRVVKAP